MLTLEKFTGINNVQPAERLQATDLVSALNVDLGLSGEPRRRGGYGQLSDECHKNLYQADGFLLATVAGDLTAIHEDGSRVLLYESLGMSRLHYCALPDGRVAWSNGLINGVTDGRAATGWGVPLPESAGFAQAVAGELDPGPYLYQIAYVRLSDRLEGGSVFGGRLEVPAHGGVLLTGLPWREGFAINVYLSAAGGDQTFLAGCALGDAFSYLGKTATLVLPCRVEQAGPAPVGTAMAWWRTRALVAQGNVLWASRPHGWETFSRTRDFKQFSAPITLVQPVDDGIWVGTEKELAWLGGVDFDGLAYRRAMAAPVVPGSGVAVPGELVSLGDGPGQGAAMVCIAGGMLVAGFNGGSLARLSQERYRTSAREVAATFRVVDGIPQYIAVPQ
ncbi:MAG: hypothetical protein JO200_21215 [Comamonas sp.]|nr:hypothetical protein [Comamonas sp.]